MPAPSIIADVPDALAELVDHDAEVRLIAERFGFLEGPVWLGDRLVFSDIPKDTLHVYTPNDGKIGVFRQPSHNANGNTLDPDGHLVTCEHGTRVVSITEPAVGGERRVIAETFDHAGRRVRFNSPNDVQVHPTTRAIFFTDPPWGLQRPQWEQAMEYGEPDEPYGGGRWVFRLDAGAESAVPVTRDFRRPNGLCFSPDVKTLYINDDERRHVRRFDVGDDGSLAGGDVFCEIDVGGPDGMRCDERGNVWCTAGDGVHVFDPLGTRLGKVLCPQSPANCRFGGDGLRTLFMTARTGLYAVETRVAGLRGG